MAGAIKLNLKEAIVKVFTQLPRAVLQYVCSQFTSESPGELCKNSDFSVPPFLDGSDSAGLGGGLGICL